MATRLFVGSLSYNVTDQMLSEAFAQAGTVVSAKVIIDRMTGRSKGFGFVEMSTDEEAKKAIETMNGKEVDGRPIAVNEARPMEPRTGGGGGGYRGGGGGGRGGYGGGGGGYRGGGGGGGRRDDRRDSRDSSGGRDW
ncbi:RNA-binding protein [Candidatus Gottesmanbacteria bacterium]|nr:RNA-binding protein [Candidatus Gottesmanbacteria bacterium]